MSESNDPHDLSVEASLRGARDIYQWYRDYLAPIPTLFNPKLDPCGAAPQAAMANSAPALEFEPTSYMDLLFSEDERVLVDQKLADLEELFTEDTEDIESSDEYEELTRLITDALSLEENSEEDGEDTDAKDDDDIENVGSVFSKKITRNKAFGIPKPEMPPALGYITPRVAFQNLTNNPVTKRLKKSLIIKTPEDYQKVYDAYLKTSKRKNKKILGFKGFAQLYNSDEMFGWQRLAGVNPRTLMRLGTERLERLLEKVHLTDAHVHAAGASEGLADEAKAGRLYYCDYWLLDGIPVQEKRHLPPAIGVFWSDARTTQLRPVAIQLKQTPSTIYTPTSPSWKSARALFQIADFNYHEMGTHLCEGHFAQEAFVIAYRRNLNSQHALAKLFDELYWALVFNNTLGRMQLVNSGGYAEKMMAGTLEGSLQIVKDYYVKVWHWDDWDLDKYIAKQGTGDARSLPVYPYRDDGLPLWAAIKTFAAQYVSAYYSSDAKVAGDRELANFVGELVDPEMGNLASKGFPTTITTKQELSGVLARLIWQAGPGHGGINYSQYQYFASIANAAGAAYADYSSAELPDIMKILPRKREAIIQGEILSVLTQRVFGRLGRYRSRFVNKLKNRQAKAAVKDFQNALAACTRDVKRRNETPARRSRKYPFMDPSNLPNSTNI